MGRRLIALAVQNATAVECRFLTASHVWRSGNHLALASPETRAESKARVSLPRCRPPLIRQKGGGEEEKQTRARGTCALSRAVCASGCVLRGRPNFQFASANQESGASRSHALWLGVEWRHVQEKQ